MFTLNLNSNFISKILNPELSTTPREIFAENSINPTTSMVFLNGRIISSNVGNQENLDKSFEELGVELGENVTMSVIVKSDGAR